MYADDTKVFRTIKGTADTQMLQKDLDKIFHWTEDWLLRLHPGKCKTLHIGTKSPPQTYTITNDKIPLQQATHEKDLGIITDNKITFQLHIDSQVKKANRIMGIIRRRFSHLTPQNFSLLFKSLVRPHLDYATSVWSPHLARDITAIEKAQRRATKQIPAIKLLPYNERLKTLNLTTLHHRRARGDLIEVYKQMNHYSVENTLTPPKPVQRARTHPLQLEKRHCRTAKRLHSFTYRVVNLWNSLPCQIATAPSINSFKNRLDKFLNNHPSKYYPDERLNSLDNNIIEII
eukprot:GHVO01022187.1.p1 GENE.GHVO01022187.1~~GHVO01022187.1.p1  ORF type:complete len:298 (+),score=6.32 GHVO01022187.1:29-895(+)